MIFRKVVENFKESYRSDLRHSVKPLFKGDRSKFESYRGGAETLLEIVHAGIFLRFSSELGKLGIGINYVDARKSPLLSADVKLELEKILSSKTMKESERNRSAAKLIRDNIK